MRKLFSKKGFDIVHPFSSDWYNEHMASVVPFSRMDEVVKLPTGTSGVLVGNTRALWDTFMAEYDANCDLQEQLHPLDAFTETSVSDVLSQLNTDPATAADTADIYFCHDTRPDRIISFQRLAHCSALAHYSPELGLCLHPQYGAWLAFRTAIIFNSRDATKMSNHRAPSLLPFPCSEETRSAVLKFQQENPPSTWKDWLALRDLVVVGKDWRYEDQQLIYHYTHQLI